MKNAIKSWVIIQYQIFIRCIVASLILQNKWYWFFGNIQDKSINHWMDYTNEYSQGNHLFKRKVIYEGCYRTNDNTQSMEKSNESKQLIHDIYNSVEYSIIHCTNPIWFNRNSNIFKVVSSWITNLTNVIFWYLSFKCENTIIGPLKRFHLLIFNLIYELLYDFIWFSFGIWFGKWLVYAQYINMTKTFDHYQICLIRFSCSDTCMVY